MVCVVFPIFLDNTVTPVVPTNDNNSNCVNFKMNTSPIVHQFFQEDRTAVLYALAKKSRLPYLQTTQIRIGKKAVAAASRVNRTVWISLYRSTAR